MKLDIQQVLGITKLNLEGEQLAQFEKELSAVQEWIAPVQSANTQGVEPMVYAVELQNVFRKDELIPYTDREAILRNAPVHDGEFFIVPKLLD